MAQLTENRHNTNLRRTVLEPPGDITRRGRASMIVSAARKGTAQPKSAKMIATTRERLDKTRAHGTYELADHKEPIINTAHWGVDRPMGERTAMGSQVAELTGDKHITNPTPTNSRTTELQPPGDPNETCMQTEEWLQHGLVGMKMAVARARTAQSTQSRDTGRQALNRRTTLGPWRNRCQMGLLYLHGRRERTMCEYTGRAGRPRAPRRGRPGAAAKR